MSKRRWDRTQRVRSVAQAPAGAANATNGSGSPLEALGSCPPCRRRFTDELLERTAERGFGFVADLSRHGQDFRLSVRELARGELGAPVREVVDRRLADEIGEA